MKIKNSRHQTLQHISLSVLFACATSALATSNINTISSNQALQINNNLSVQFKQDDRDWFTQYSEPGAPIANSVFGIDQQFELGSLHFASGQADNERLDQFGLSYGNASVYGFSGYGETTTRLSNSFSNIDPYHFHGGLSSNLDYSGYRLGYQANNTNHFSFTHANVKSQGLDDRSVYAMSWQGKTFNLSLMDVEVGGQNAGQVLAFGADVGKHRFSLQGLKAQNDASYVGLGYQTSFRKGKSLSINVEQMRNPLFASKNENRITFNFGFQFGQSSTALYADGEKQEGGSSAATTTLLAVGGTLGAAALLSSGSGGDNGGDNRPRFSSQNEAGRAVLNEINPTSVSQNLEYGGYVYINADGSYSSLAPIRGQAASVLLPNPATAAPSGSRVTASYHTHAAFDPRFDNENFSPTDIAGDRAFNIDGYLATPEGRFWLHDVSANQIILLGQPGTIATQ